ncbi:MAG: DUF1549 domain-containing protein [Planctomycetia bacterium]|nr:DUF1549 domain-containing protein [Planctomycetia bacterium]
MRLRLSSSVPFTICVLSASLLVADEVAPAKIHVYPADVQLTTARDQQSLIVQTEYPDGITRDVTAEAKFTLANMDLANVQANVLRPKADGASELKVEFGAHSVIVPVEVHSATVDRPISFKLDVMPVFMKSGCNTGSCHGAARGKDGFRLSLFGFDPDGDYDRLTREISGRRINLAVPEESLLIEKSVGAVPHTGGKRFDMDSGYNESLLRWLRARAPKDQGELPQVVSVEVYPRHAVLDGAQKRGEAFIMARFGTHTVGTHFIVLPKGLQFQWQEVAANNYVDELMLEKFKKLRIQPSELCTDEEFLRRVTIDITGALPTVEEYYAFIQDTDPAKRDKVVDDLLGRKEFVELWVMKWAELLQIRTTQQITTKPMLRFYNWVQERIASNMPMDQMVRELLGASGGTFANAATNYYQMESDPNKVSENITQVFMGMRLQCAQCHNHPFDRWTMDDYYGFAAFFSQIGRKASEDPREQIIFNRGSGEVNHPVGNRRMEPKFLGGAVPDVNGKDRRVVMAEWLASADNPYFATNLANIVWNHFFGRGIINEVDDVRVSNPPVNPELLSTLGQKFTEYNYDFKKLVRDICTSRTYQLGTKTNESNKGDDRNFSHATIRRLRAEVLLDAISQVTDTKNKFPGLPTGARAVQIANGNTSNYFLTTFGRATRESVCACEVKMEPNLSQALHLLNGDTLQTKIQGGKLIEKRLTEKVAPAQIIEEIYIRCLTRKPLETEMKELLAVLDQEKADQRVLEDVFWALLNSREFVFNH